MFKYMSNHYVFYIYCIYLSYIRTLGVICMYLGYLHTSINKVTNLFRENIDWKVYRTERKAPRTMPWRCYPVKQFVVDLNKVEVFLLKNFYTDESLHASLYGVMCYSPVYHHLPKIHHESLSSKASRKDNVDTDGDIGDPPITAPVPEATEEGDDNVSVISVISCDDDDAFDAKFKSSIVSQRTNFVDEAPIRQAKQKKQEHQSVLAHLPQPFIGAPYSAALQNVAAALPVFMACVSIHICRHLSAHDELTILDPKDLSHPR